MKISQMQLLRIILEAWKSNLRNRQHFWRLWIELHTLVTHHTHKLQMYVRRIYTTTYGQFVLVLYLRGRKRGRKTNEQRKKEAQRKRISKQIQTQDKQASMNHKYSTYLYNKLIILIPLKVSQEVQERSKIIIFSYIEIRR